MKVSQSILPLALLMALASTKKVEFPENFKFGSASAAYQIEGAWNADGKTASIWDTFTHNRPDMIADGLNGDVAADSYHFYEKDIAALKEVGFHHYRFSISWTRVLANGTVLNQKGIDYYNKVINALLREGIEPIVTMYHFDLPQSIQDLGGFANPILVNYFKHYADILYANFGDRVKKWITFNEPLNFCTSGYANGTFAPGIKAPGIGDYLCGHHVLQAHAAAYHLYKENYFEKQQGQVGISLSSRFFFSKDGNDALVDKALEFQLGWFTNPIFSKLGNYPQVMIDQVDKNSKDEGRSFSRLPLMSDAMIKSLIGSADFLGLNYYTSRIVVERIGKPIQVSHEEDPGIEYLTNPEWSRGASNWLYVVPEGLYGVLVWIKEKYGNPLVLITENGFSDNGGIDDDARINFFKGHLAAVSKAIHEGCNVEGFTVWSIIDNLEWIEGFTEKFGIFSVNMTSDQKERTKKKSANFCKHLITEKSFEE